MLVVFRSLSLICGCLFFFSSRRRHTRCALVTGVQTCALPIFRRETLRPAARPVHRSTTKNDWETDDEEAYQDAAQRRGDRRKIGRASCRERVCQYVSISVVAVSLKKKKKDIINKSHVINKSL